MENFDLNKLAKIVVAGFVGFALYSIHSIQLVSQNETPENNIVTYQMPRVESHFFNYTLDGRKINRINSGDVKLSETKLEDKSSKKVADVKKEDKKTENKKANKKTAKKDDKKSGSASENNQDIVTKNSEEKMIDAGYEMVEAAPFTYYAPIYGNVLANEAQWKNILLGSPSKEQMDKFIKQHEEELLTDKVYYSVLKEMLKDKRTQIQGLALAGIAAYKSGESLALLLEAQEWLQGKNYALARALVEDYANIQHLKYIVATLASEDTKIVVLGTEFLTKVAQESMTFKPQSGETRGVRMSASQKNIELIINSLKELLNSEDAEIVNAAQDALSQVAWISRG